MSPNGISATFTSNGCGPIAKDQREGVAWVLEKLPKKATTVRRADLGFAYLRGTGVKKDEAQGLAWIRKGSGAKQPAMPKCCWASCSCRSERGLPQNRVEAQKWLCKAAAYGMAPAQLTNWVKLTKRDGAAKQT